MNKYLTLGLIVLLPLITLAVIFYYSDYGTYLRLQYKLKQLNEISVNAGQTPPNSIIFNFINPEFHNLLDRGYIKYYYQEFDNNIDGPEISNFWTQALAVAGDNKLPAFVYKSDLCIDTRIAWIKKRLPVGPKSPSYIYFIAKEPDYSQLKAVIDSTMTPSKAESVKKPELLGLPHSYWVSLSGNTD